MYNMIYASKKDMLCIKANTKACTASHRRMKPLQQPGTLAWPQVITVITISQNLMQIILQSAVCSQPGQSNLPNYTLHRTTSPFHTPAQCLTADRCHASDIPPRPSHVDQICEIQQSWKWRIGPWKVRRCEKLMEIYVLQGFPGWEVLWFWVNWVNNRDIPNFRSVKYSPKNTYKVIDALEMIRLVVLADLCMLDSSCPAVELFTFRTNSNYRTWLDIAIFRGVKKVVVPWGREGCLSFFVFFFHVQHGFEEG